MKSFSATDSGRQLKLSGPDSGAGMDWSEDSANVCLPEFFEKNYAYPALIMLESSLSKTAQFHDSVRAISERNHVGIRVVCEPSSLGGELGNDLALSQIQKSVRSVSRYANLHSERIYLVGTGIQATLAMRLVLAEPLKFAGFLAIDPEVERGVLSVRHFRQLKHLRGMILTSTMFPAEKLRREIEMLHSSGIEIRQQSFSQAGKTCSLINNFVMQGILSGYCSV